MYLKRQIKQKPLTDQNTSREETNQTEAIVFGESNNSVHKQITATQTIDRKDKARKPSKKPSLHARVTVQSNAPSSDSHQFLDHDLESTDEEPEPIAVKPTN